MTRSSRHAPSYQDLAIRLEAGEGEGELRMRLLSSPYGDTPAVPCPLPWSAPDHSGLLRQLEGAVWRSGQGTEQGTKKAAGDSVRGLNLLLPDDEPPGLDPEGFGRALFGALRGGAFGEKFLNSLRLTQAGEQTHLRIRLSFDPERVGRVGSMPWELLCWSDHREFLGRNLRTPIVRHLITERPILRPEPLSHLRILLVLSSPAGFPPLGIERERTLVEDAWAGFTAVELTFLRQPTLERLRREVRDRPFDVLHFIGHGEISPEGEGTVILETAEGRGDPVRGAVLADTLKGLKAIRLVFLNACETARLPRTEEGHDPYLGVASALIMSGVSAVVAMQFPISDRAAVTFSRTFYAALAAGDPLEAAVAEGRLATWQAQPRNWEWATPVLFMGLPDGNIFDLRPFPASTPEHGPEPTASAATAGVPPSPSEPASSDTHARAVELLDLYRHERAITALGEARRSDPENPALPYYLALARLEGRRPRACRLDVIRQAEADLEEAGDLAPGREPAHFLYLSALIKYDFYHFKGLKIRPPAIEELLLEARALPGDSGELGRLLDAVPVPPGPVRQAIEEHLARIRHTMPAARPRALTAPRDDKV